MPFYSVLATLPRRWSSDLTIVNYGSPDAFTAFRLYRQAVKHFRDDVEILEYPEYVEFAEEDGSVFYLPLGSHKQISEEALKSATQKHRAQSPLRA